MENDNKIHVYEGKCPASYNITDKFCIVFVTTKMNYSAAQEFCDKDGGGLINIDTKERHDLVQKYAKSFTIYIQGERRVRGGPYFDNTGKVIDEWPFVHWASG